MGRGDEHINHYREPMELLSNDATTMTPADHWGGRHLLTQVSEGADCKVSYNCVSGLVCRGETCSLCETDAECILRNNKDQCQKGNDGQNYCKHKPLFHPFDHSDMIITLITLITIILAAPAGVGGGGILVPMYLAIGKFSPHYGIPLSKATIFGGAVTNNYFNVSVTALPVPARCNLLRPALGLSP